MYIHVTFFTLRLKWASIGMRLPSWVSLRTFQSSAQAHLHMACFSLALSILGLACWLWIHKFMWIFACTSFENESCDFQKIIQSVDGAWPVCTGVRKMPVQSVNYVTNYVIACLEKSHTHSCLKRWRREHQSTYYRLHFFVWLKRWIINSILVFFSIYE